MAGMIKRDVVEEIRQKTDIKSIIEQKVTLKTAGIGTWKGLCPFHDEKTPSFTVKPQTGYYHCFGCGEGGDVFKFLMETDHLSFTEAVEDLAAKCGVTVEYEKGKSSSDDINRGSRQSVIKVNQAAMEFFQSKLGTPEAQAARTFLIERGFDKDFAHQYGIGYAPQGWTNLLTHLRDRDFSDTDIKAAVLVSEGNKGMYDRFRGRLMWPIKDVSGQVLGFGARKLYDDDPGGKYINSSETPAYKKSQVLYGLDKAKKAIASLKKVVVVEGYTDVMACHAAGIDNAVASCGTAFGKDHVRIIRRLMNDDDTSEVIFTFDGDEAGQNAVLKAFDLDEEFQAHTWVAIDPDGLDPCDVRLKKGDQGLREMLANKRPLFEFVLDTIFKQHSTQTSEQRYNALKALAPVLNKIKNPTIQADYVRKVAGWLGMVDNQVVTEMEAARRGKQAPFLQPQDTVQEEAATQQPRYTRPDPRDKVANIERQVLEISVQYPMLLKSDENQELFLTSIFEVEAYNEVAQAVRENIFSQVPAGQWVSSIRSSVPSVLESLVGELSMAQIPARTDAELLAYGTDLLKRLAELELDRSKNEANMRLERLGSTASFDDIMVLQQELQDIEVQRRKLRGE
ncbi:MAG: DNA primase [Micrococcaceae bacterium]